MNFSSSNGDFKKVQMLWNGRWSSGLMLVTENTPGLTLLYLKRLGFFEYRLKRKNIEQITRLPSFKTCNYRIIWHKRSTVRIENAMHLKTNAL